MKNLIEEIRYMWNESKLFSIAMSMITACSLMGYVLLATIVF